jgi:hypothetical protein
MFCAIDQKHGSQMLRSFIAPMEKSEDMLDDPTSHWKVLPENAIGRYMHTAAVTSNGRFLVTVENGMMRLLALCGAYGGGLSCLEQPLEWRSTLKNSAKEVSGVSLSVRERLAGLDIYAVDGRGHVLFVRISSPGMPVTAPPALTRQPSPKALEPPANIVVKELEVDTSELRIRSDSGFRSGHEVLRNDGPSSFERRNVSQTAVNDEREWIASRPTM